MSPQELSSTLLLIAGRHTREGLLLILGLCMLKCNLAVLVAHDQAAWEFRFRRVVLGNLWSECRVFDASRVRLQGCLQLWYGNRERGTVESAPNDPNLAAPGTLPDMA